jgi:hypothetical protein
MLCIPVVYSVCSRLMACIYKYEQKTPAVKITLDLVVQVSIITQNIPLDQWFPTCSTRTLGGKRRTSWGYTKIILVMAEYTKKKKRN